MLTVCPSAVEVTTQVLLPRVFRSELMLRKHGPQAARVTVIMLGAVSLKTKVQDRASPSKAK